MAENLRAQIDRLRDRATDNEEIADRDSDLLIAFSDRIDLHAQEYTDYRHKKLLGTAVRIAERQDTPLADAFTDRRAAESIVAWINRTYDNEETNRDYPSILRVFGSRVTERRDDLDTDADGVPEALAWISTSTSSTYDPTPDPREMLQWDDDVVVVARVGDSLRLRL